MKITIPEQLKADMPQTPWGKLFAATPIIMTVLSTMLAGLASSEMTRAQYDRALAAQQQSKAGDQWSFFQAKRLRGAIQHNSVDLLQSVVGLRPLDAAGLKDGVENVAAKGDEASKAKTAIAELANSPEGQKALLFLQNGDIPKSSGEFNPTVQVKAAMDAVEASKSDAVMSNLLSSVKDADLEDALHQARDRVEAFDDMTGPINRAIDNLDSQLGRLGEFADQNGETMRPGGVGLAGGWGLQRDFTAARLRYAAMRYEAEARLNQSIANLYELQVRKSNASAERHHARSQRFFYGMLAAQMGVIVATFAMAARQRNLLWSIAAVAGLGAIGLGVYVYLCV